MYDTCKTYLLYQNVYRVAKSGVFKIKQQGYLFI